VRVIVGLGNPGKQYAHTPHNVGFEVIETLAARLDCSLRRSFRFQARTGKAVVNGEPWLLVQPQGYMNNSGTALAPLLRTKGAQATDLIVAVDDADLEIGRLRVRARGSSGGHKGLASLIASLGTEGFARVRIGIGRDSGGGDLVEHVLTPFSVEERRKIDEAIARAADAVLCVVESGVDAAMNRFNA
jgi:PTH1 family peptidyl-tRNA hydrolase